MFPENRIDNSTACFVTSGVRKLAANNCIAKSFLHCILSEHQCPIASGQVPGLTLQSKAGGFEQGRHIGGLIPANLNGNDAVRLEMGRRSAADPPVGIQPVGAAIQRL